MLVAGQVQDACQRGPGRQACQQAEPAVPQGDGDGPSGRGHEAHLHQAGEQPSGRVGNKPGHGGRVGACQPAGSHCYGGEHHGQDQAAADQADDVARMTITSRRREPT